MLLLVWMLVSMISFCRGRRLPTTPKIYIQVNAPGSLGETEFYGGEQTDEPENDDFAAETWRPMFSLSHARLTAILSRHSEIDSASRKGRKSAAVIQTKIFDDCCHTVLNAPVRASNVKPQKAQLSYAHPHSINAALLHQDAIVTEMRNAQIGSEAEI